MLKGNGGVQGLCW